MSTYLCTTTFGSFRFESDLSQASAPIRSLPDTGDDTTEPQSSPYQTADARHDSRRAARLLLETYGADYWLDPSDPVTEDADGTERYAGKTADEYMDSLIVSVDAE